MAPTGWRYALLVWAYALLSFGVASMIKIAVYRLLDHREARQERHLSRVEGNLMPHATKFR
ncbi:hypothetical protein PWP93_36880 [Paraburkholderia sp. A1RI-2L]